MPYGKKDSSMQMKGSWMSKHVQNLFKEMPIDNKASALEMDKGSAAYMKDDMAPKMEKGSAAYLHDEFTQKNNIKHK